MLNRLNAWNYALERFQTERDQLDLVIGELRSQINAIARSGSSSGPANPTSTQKPVSAQARRKMQLAAKARHAQQKTLAASAAPGTISTSTPATPAPRARRSRAKTGTAEKAMHAS